MSFNILVYGLNGWIGKQFETILKNGNVKYKGGKARVDNESQLRLEIQTTKPTHIISFIGRTHGVINDKTYSTIDYLEQKGKLVENIRDNLYGPLLLCNICKSCNIHFTYLGTGCIFKFNNDHPFGKQKNGFTEDSLPNFFGSSYSIVKGFTDRLIKLYDNVLNLRIRMPISDTYNSRNFITKITTYEKICSIPNSMTVLPELLPYILKMMKMGLTGTINFTNPGLISHNEILDMYKEIVDSKFTYKNFSVEEQRLILEADRSNNYLDTTKLQKLFPEILNIKDSIKDVLTKYKNTLPKKNLLVTGGCGFIGSNFINYYHSKQKFNTIVNIDAMYYCANEKNIDTKVKNDKNYKFIKGNLQNYDLVKSILLDNQITHVIHFAAQSHVQNSFTDAISYTYDNILGTHNLLEAVRVYGKIKKFIHVSTDEVYGESMLDINTLQKTEHEILCPTNPYAATKAGAELLAQSYYHSFKIPIIITRGNNVYGVNQYPEKLIPLFISQLKNNKKVTIQGDGSNVRSFLHVYDTVRAFDCILDKGKIGEIYNIGCDTHMEYTVMNVAKILIKLLKKTDDYQQWIEYIEDRPYNDKRYYISNQKLKDLGWRVTIDFETGIENLITKMAY